MSDLDNQPMPDESIPDDSMPGDPAEWDGFELQLRARSLGSGPPRRDDLLYQCGYAAGVAASMKQRRASVLRWQAFSVAAALLACVALAANFRSDESTNRAKQVVLNSQATHEPSEVAGSGVKQASDPFWVALLTRDRSQDSQPHGQLRTAGMKLNDLEPGELEGVVVPMSHGGRGTTPQPSDFPLFLQGEV